MRIDPGTGQAASFTYTSMVEWIGG